MWSLKAMSFLELKVSKMITPSKVLEHGLSRKDIQNDLGFIKLPDSIDEVTFMVMKETENLRKTYVLERGSYDAPSREVKPMTPSAVLPINKSFSTGILKIQFF